MKNFLLAFSFMALLAGCNKDKFETKPQITLKEIGDRNVPYLGTLRVVLNFTDKQGDVDDTLFVRRYRTNLRTTATVRDSLKIKVPEFPDRNQGDLVLDLTYQNYLISAAAPPNCPTCPNGKEPDSLTYKFVLKDKAGNYSDTLVVDGIVVERR